MGDAIYALQKIPIFSGIRNTVGQFAAIEQSIYFNSVTFAIVFSMSLVLNILVIGCLDWRLKYHMQASDMMEHSIEQLSKKKKNLLYIFMMFSILVWGIIQQGAYVATADFIYFQF